MRFKMSLFFLFLFFQINFSTAQNYLRIENPNSWSAINSQHPDWPNLAAHGVFQDVSIIVEPKGIYTEIEFYATITHDPDFYSWTDEYEIIWQFELPNNAIVHDSWLWINEELIVQADMVDYWTALQTYEGIVERNQDPSFFYQLADKRYEIRIYPLFDGDFRKIKMSFLIPSKWEDQTLISDVLHHLLQSTDVQYGTVTVGVPASDAWPEPVLNLDGASFPLSDSALASSGNLIQYVTLSVEDLISIEDAKLVFPSPLSDNNTFLSTYIEDGEQYYQLAFAPDWNEIGSNELTRKSLLLVDYNESKTSLSKMEFVTYLQTALVDHFSTDEAVNIAVMSNDGVRFLSESWWGFDASTFADELLTMLELQGNSNLVALLENGFEWAQSQGDASDVFLLVANDDYVYPPVADEIILELSNSLPTNIPLTIFDYQDENLSVIFYEEEEYHGNAYFYQLLTSNFEEAFTVVLRETNDGFAQAFSDVFPQIGFPQGIVDYTTTLENGICYQRYSISSSVVNEENKGILLQTGRYLGDFPMNIEANLVKTNGEILTVHKTIDSDEIVAGDALMRTMWYGSYLKSLEAQSNSENDIEQIVQTSIDERVLTGLTAFLALEPSLGGEPCITCLLSNNVGPFVATEEIFNPDEAILLITPNPVSTYAQIQLKYATSLSPEDWTATIVDMTGKQLFVLEKPTLNNGVLEWNWLIDNKIQAGIYLCEIQSEFGNLVGKIIIL